MGEMVFIQGNEALAESAIRAGCKCYFGYPITPASEITEYYAAKMPKENGVFIQSETEVSGMNMVAGVAATGKRAMMATSGPGISLGAEAMSFMACAELPAVIVNVMRPGPGDGDIVAAQGDYFQAVKGAGHGDYNLIVLAPYSGQETADLTVEAFELAEKYRNPVMILTDATIGKMMESVKLPDDKTTPNKKFDWALTGAKDRQRNVITTCAVNPEQFERHNLKLQEKYNLIKQNEQRWQNYRTEDADIIMVAYGIVSRIALTTIKKARENGIKAGMIRPITLWPFPEKAFKNQDKDFFVVELSAGQMVEDVKLSVKDKERVKFYGRMGGMSPTPDELYNKICELYKRR